MQLGIMQIPLSLERRAEARILDAFRKSGTGKSFMAKQTTAAFLRTLARAALLLVGATALLVGAPSAAGAASFARHADEIDAIFEKAQLDLRAPGLVYGVVADGRLVHVRGFGERNLETGAPVNKDAAFRIASMTKMMTGLIIGDLVDEGKILLDAPAENYVPEMKAWAYPTTDSRKVTVRDLVNHTAGFETDDPWADRQMHRTNEEFDAFLKIAEPFTNAPGARWEYSNLGFALLGRVIENVTGNTYQEEMHARIFTPLGMKGSGLEVANLSPQTRAFGYNWINDAFVEEPVLASGSFDPLGGVWTTAADYGRFVSWMLSAWPARNDPETGPIPRRVVRSVTDAAHVLGVGRRTGRGGAADCVMARGYSMGLIINHHCDAGLVLSHAGGFPGFGAFVAMAPEQRIGVFAFANRTYAKVHGPVWDALIRLVAEDFGDPIPPAAADKRLLAAHEGVAGAYAAGAIKTGSLAFADNFFLDRDETRWNAQLAAIKKTAGACKPEKPFKQDGRLSGAFAWRCERARVAGYIMMSPLNPAEIQMLRLRPVMLDQTGGDLITDYDFH